MKLYLVVYLVWYFLHIVLGASSERYGIPASVPCDPSGGQIKQLDSCPWWIDWSPDGDRSQCTKYDACVCRDGFKGDRCEHDCKMTICPDELAPVCVWQYSGKPDITFPSKCTNDKAKCNKEQVSFKYDGECQDDARCGFINCPMDVAVEYYDDPNKPGCKLCRVAL